ncbi:MAG: CHAD domain-containing protein [Mycobacteriales bacterium]
MTMAVLEIERKYDVDSGAVLPDLAGMPGVARTGQAAVHELVAHYLDTQDLRLRAAGVTLRHRAGGEDGGWHLKLPLGEDREELRVAGEDPTAPVPPELQALVRAIARDQPLVPVAQLITRRTVRQLLDDAGSVLAEVVDDDVQGAVPGAPEDATTRWREWEVELGSGDRELLDVVERRLLEAGAERSGSPSKVGRVLAGRAAEPGVPAWWSGPTGRAGTSGQVVQAHLRAQVDELVARDPQVRRDLPDAVHKMRVATRRLRSALRTFRPLLDRTTADPIRDELRWLAGVLGEARDVEVMHARLRELIASQPEELVMGPVLSRVDLVIGGRYRHAHERVVGELDGPRYLRLLEALEALATAPPFQDRARGPAREVLAPLVRRTWTRLDKTMRAAERATGEEQDLLLHEARKQAKAVRYAAESVEPAFGRRAVRFARAVERLQEVLGEHQDGVVTREALRELGAASSKSGENGFTFGRLHGLEESRAAAAGAGWPQIRAEVSAPKLRRWLD